LWSEDLYQYFVQSTFKKERSREGNADENPVVISLKNIIAPEVDVENGGKEEGKDGRGISVVVSKNPEQARDEGRTCPGFIEPILKKA
jgi:hypothetical protein